MIGLAICSMALLTTTPATPAPPETETYAEARSRAGRAPEDQVRLALWCEAHGLAAERLHHLTLAVLADPKNATARGLMGLVDHQGRWQRPESVADRLQGEPALVEYEARRLEATETAEGQLAMGIWAEDHGLADQARAHFTASTRLDPSHDDAWKRLGHVKRGGRWVTEAQSLAEKAEVEARKQADRKWKPLLEKYRQMLATPSRRDEAEAALAVVTDSRAVASIVRVFGTTEPLQPRAVRLLGQVDAPESTRALAFLAVFARSIEARRAATETLRGRDPREYADALIALLVDPIRFEVKHVDGPSSPGELLIEGKRANLRRLYTPPTVFQPGDHFDFDDLGRAVVVRSIAPSSGNFHVGEQVDTGQSRVNGMTTDEVRKALPIIGWSALFNPFRATTKFTFQFGDQASIPVRQMATEARKSAEATERQLLHDARMLEDHNVGVRVGNDRVAGVLNDATRQSMPADRRAWTNWWVDRVGYASSSTDWTSKASVVEDVAIAYQPPAMPDGASRDILDYDRRSCFGAGTPVRTIAGPRAIETLRVGDRVLTQNTGTGSLGYRPILAVHHNPPSPTLRITMKGRAIVSSHFHRFWVAGRGWAMARDLRPGDSIRVLDGVSPIESIAAGSVQPVYNLDVADDADFFAGDAVALVHDNNSPDPRLAPFDAPKAK